MENEKRLIDANAVQKRIRKTFSRLTTNLDRAELAAALMAVGDYINEAPTVNAAEVVHASWIDAEDGETRCSNCETRIPEMYSNADTVIKSECRFCHYCGAKMDG